MKLLEIAVFNMESALLAVEAGADRLELCENPEEGGTTPSYGALQIAMEKISIPVFPIIRPRGGDFLYDDTEVEMIKRDLLLCKQLGFPGAVLGMLKKDGSIDTDQTSRLVEWSYPLEITFHRAFDRAKDPLQSLKDIIQTGCSRILTSGQRPNVGNGLELVTELVREADGDIIIMPGSGVRMEIMEQLLGTGASEFHSSARKQVKSTMAFKVPEMAESLDRLSVDTTEIKQMKALLQSS